MTQYSYQLNFAPNQASVVNATRSFDFDQYFQTQHLRNENQMNEFSNLFFSQRLLALNQLFLSIQQNSSSIKTISKKLDVIEDLFQSMKSDLSCLEQENSKTGKEDRESTEEESGSCSSFKKQAKLHYKDLFREKMFGSKQYRFRLNVEGKIPQTIYKERNMRLKINLVDLYENSIGNENAISLHLKMFYSNGEEIGTTKKGESFMKGSLNCTLINGGGLFDKLYPREVSRKMGTKKIVLVVYASGMGNVMRECPSRVDPNEIEPLIIYGVRVVTKQNKENKQKKEQMDSEENESQFTP